MNAQASSVLEGAHATGSAAVSRHVDVADLPSQAPARSQISAHLAAASVEDATIGDVLVVVSELVANALEHGRAPSVAVDVTVAGRRAVELVVTHEEEAPSIPRPSDMPSPDAHRGRGLALVAALTTSFRSEVDGRRVVTRCTVGDDERDSDEQA